MGWTGHRLRAQRVCRHMAGARERPNGAQGPAMELGALGVHGMFKGTWVWVKGEDVGLGHQLTPV